MAEIFIGVQVASALWGAQAAADARNAQAAIARMQAEIAMTQSKFTARMQLKRGRQEAVARRRSSRRAVGGAVVAVAGAGVELSGSPMAVIGEKIRHDELNAAQVVTNARARAFSERAKGRGQATTFTAQAQSLDSQASIIRVTGFLNAINIGMVAAGGRFAQTGGGLPGSGISDEESTGDFLSGFYE